MTNRSSVGIVAAVALILSLGGAFMRTARAQEKDKDAGDRQEVRLPKPNPNAGYLGAKFGPVTDDVVEDQKLDSHDGVVLLEFLPDSPGEKAGLKTDDVIRKIDGATFGDVRGFVAKMRQTKPGQQMKFAIVRETKEQEITVTLGKRPPELNEGDKERPTTKPD